MTHGFIIIIIIFFWGGCIYFYLYMRDAMVSVETHC